MLAMGENSLPKNTNDPLEMLVAKTLDHLEIRYVCPDSDKGFSTLKKLDFFIPDWNLYIECKAWGSARLHKQVEEVNNCIVLIGLAATARFCEMLKQNFH